MKLTEPSAKKCPIDIDASRHPKAVAFSYIFLVLKPSKESLVKIDGLLVSIAQLTVMIFTEDVRLECGRRQLKTFQLTMKTTDLYFLEKFAPDVMLSADFMATSS